MKSCRMYIANKLSKYGLKIVALTYSKTYYTVNIEIYAGQKDLMQLATIPKIYLCTGQNQS